MQQQGIIRCHSFKILAIGLVLSSIYGCAFLGRTEEDKTSNLLTNQQFSIPDIGKTNEIAANIALDWSEEAILTNIDLAFAPISAEQQLRSYYGFESGPEGRSWLLVQLTEGNNREIRVSNTTEDIYEVPRENAEPIQLEEIYLSPKEALAIGLAAAENELPRVILTDIRWPGSLELMHSDSFYRTGPLQWSVSLRQSSTNGAFHAIIDDQSGEIVEIRNYIN